MDKQQITEIIENFAPLNLAEEWDCSGWVVNASSKNEICRILLCLTITDDIVRQAKENSCDMIISHHPLFFVPFGYKDINIYCSHTNFDKTNGGTTDTLIKKLGFTSTDFEHEFVRIVETNITVSELDKKLRTVSPDLRYVNNNGKEELKTIGFCAGSGSEFIDEIDCDAFVTGDLKFHKAVECDKVVFDIGHFESEILVLDVFEKLLSDKVEVVRAKERSPFIY